MIKLFKKMTNVFTSWLRGEKAFYSNVKQTILHILHRILVGLFALDIVFVSMYCFAPSNKENLISIFAIITGSATVVNYLTILWFHFYYVHIKKDIAPLQSEKTQLIKEILTRAEGDSGSGITLIDVVQALQEEKKGEPQG